MDFDDLTRPDYADAVLRDPNVPADVRGLVLTLHNAGRYLDTIDIEDDGNGFLTVVPRRADAPAVGEVSAPPQPAASVPEAPPAQSPAQPAEGTPATVPVTGSADVAVPTPDENSDATAPEVASGDTSNPDAEAPAV